MRPQRKAFHPLLRAAFAGIAAGIIATPVQMFCWWIGGASAWQLLLRDTRLAAAILLGPGVLPPPLNLSLPILIAAGTVHFLLSASYGVVLSPAIRMRMSTAVAAGAAFGALLFGVNMYGFTAAFPWFVASRDWATFAAHLAFGASAAGLIRRWA